MLTMKTSPRQICKHDCEYDSNSKILFMSLVTNCTRCYLELFDNMSEENNIQIHQLKIFGQRQWIRRNRRLVRIRNSFDPNPKCEKLGVECDYEDRWSGKRRHRLEVTSEIPVNYDKNKNTMTHHSFTCFPKYKENQSEYEYKKEISLKKQKKIRIITKINRYLAFEGICYQCGETFDVRRDLQKHNNEHVKAEMGYESELWR